MRFPSDDFRWEKQVRYDKRRRNNDMSMAFFRNAEMTSADIAMVKNVFSAWCKETGTAPDSPQAEKISVELMDWFQFGIRRHHQLLEMIRPL
jgi:hypothetical protein